MKILKKGGWLLRFFLSSKLCYAPSETVLGIGDMPKFSETQKLQNMLRQCHILSYIFEARKRLKSPLLKAFLETKRIEKIFFFPMGFWARKLVEMLSPVLSFTSKPTPTPLKPLIFLICSCSNSYLLIFLSSYLLIFLSSYLLCPVSVHPCLFLLSNPSLLSCDW